MNAFRCAPFGPGSETASEYREGSQVLPAPVKGGLDEA